MTRQGRPVRALSRTELVDQLVTRLVACRMRRRISQGTLAVLLGISQQALSQWEGRRTRPSRRMQRVWALTLGEEPLPERPPVRETCGTQPGYEHHRRTGEDQCDPCADAQVEYMRAYRAARAGRPGPAVAA